MTKIVVHVKAQARSQGIEIVSLNPPILKVKTPKPPEKDLANQDVLAQLAQYFSCFKSHLSIISGKTYTTKLVEIALDSISIDRTLREKENFLL